MRAAQSAALAVLVALLLPAVLSVGVPPASACSCSGIDPIDAVQAYDVVFAGTPVANEGDEIEPLWRFQVSGVIKGEIESSELVGGGDWGGGCGTDFSPFFGREPIVVYAFEQEAGLFVGGCTPNPTEAEFAALVDAMTEPSGAGPPVAVVSGIIEMSNLAVLDGQGRAITRGVISSESGENVLGTVAHCPGTTRIALASSGRDAAVQLVDLTTMTVVDRRGRPDTNILHPGQGDIDCLDDGSTVVTRSGYGPGNQYIDVVVSHRNDDGEEQFWTARFDDVSRTVVDHDAGTIIVLPSRVGAPLRVLHVLGLDLIAEAADPLPTDVTMLDADFSPDGSQLAVLASSTGEDVVYDSGADQVLVFDVDDGVPSGPPRVIPLADAGRTTEAITGALQQIRWVDDSTWILQAQRIDGSLLRFVETDGTEVVPRTGDASLGYGMTAVPGGIMRVSNGGLQFVGVDGVQVAGDPAPAADVHSISGDRFLWIAPLIDAPDFEPARLTMQRPQIVPVPPGSTSVAGTIPAGGTYSAAPDVGPDGDETSFVQGLAEDRAGGETGSWWWMAAVGLLVVGAGAATVGLQRRRQPQSGP